MGKKSKKKPEYENIKVPKAYVDMLRGVKESTGVSISAFACQAINKKLSNQKYRDHLEWIYSRMVNMHKEDPNADYMIKFRSILDII